MKYSSGLVAGQLAGHAGSTVARVHRGGGVLSVKTSGRHRETPATSLVQTALATNAQLWRALTSSQRAQWQQFAAQLHETTRLTSRRQPTAFETFMRLQTNSASLGNGQLLTPPPLLFSSVVGPFSLTLNGTGTVPNTTSQTTGTGFTIVVASVANIQANDVISIAGGTQGAIVTGVVVSTRQVGLDRLTTSTNGAAITITKTPHILLTGGSASSSSSMTVPWLTPIMSPGISRPRPSAYRPYPVVPTQALSTFDLVEAYTYAPTTARLYSRVFLRLQNITSTGIPINDIVLSATATAPV
jgi:hypothetical protein